MKRFLRSLDRTCELMPKAVKLDQEEADHILAGINELRNSRLYRVALEQAMAGLKVRAEARRELILEKTY